MENIGKRLLNYIESKNIDLSHLAQQIEINELDLKRLLETNKIELRILEKISKETRIPFYSFFSTIEIEEYLKQLQQTVPNYTESLTPEALKEIQNLVSSLQLEIERLKKIILSKDQEIIRLQEMLNNKKNISHE
jgi:hypothetical protein